MLKFDPYDFESRSIDGVPVYVKKVPWSNGFVYVRALIQAGGLEDPIGKEGTAHFLEHMVFDGCEGFPTYVDIDRAGRRLFLDTLNAWTNLEYTVYHGKTGHAELPEALRFLGTMLFKPLMADAEIERERGVIEHELWDRFSSEKDEALAKKLRAMTYGDHPFSRMATVIGWHETVPAIRKEDLVGFHRTRYVSGNVRLILVGDVGFDRDMEAIEAFLSSCPKGRGVAFAGSIPAALPPAPEFVFSAKEYFGISDAASVPKTTTIVAQRVTPLEENRELPFMARMLLWRLLFDRIRGELGAMYSPSVSTFIERDHLRLEIAIDTKPDTADQVRKIIAAVLAEVAAGDPRHGGMFAELKRADLERILFTDLNADDMADNAGGMLRQCDKIIPLAEIYADASRVGYTDVSAFVRREWTPEKLFWRVMTP